MPVTVVVLTKLPDRLPVKTRLVPLLGADGARAFYVASLAATIEAARAFGDTIRIAYSPADAPPPGPDYVPVAGSDGATCLERAIADAYAGHPVVVLGGDAPDLPRDRLDRALAALADADVAVVPTGDGGFSCLALRRPVDGLAGGFSYGGDDALESLAAFLVRRGLRVATLPPWPDVDTPAQYHAYLARRAGGAG